MEYRKHLQAFIDRWRYNANRGTSVGTSLIVAFADLWLDTSRTGTVPDQDTREGMVSSQIGGIVGK